MLMAYRLVRLIEEHSDTLAQNLLNRVQHSLRASDYKLVPAEELRQRVYEIYRNLGDWLLGKTELDIEERYREIGERRVYQGVPLSQLIHAIFTTKDNLWEFLMNEAVIERPAEVFGEMELLQLLDQFFDRAIYYATLGYEHAQAGQKEKAAV
jgi:hypothetical protein